MTSAAASLRVFARVEDPSPEMFEYLAVKEHVQSPNECWVDLATPRDFEFSDEIREKTVQFGLVDDEGEVLATFDTLAEAEAVRSTAKIKFSIALDDEPENPRGAPKASEALRTETSSISGQTSIVGDAAGL